MMPQHKQQQACGQALNKHPIDGVPQGARGSQRNKIKYAMSGIIAPIASADHGSHRKIMRTGNTKTGCESVNGIAQSGLVDANQ